MKELLQGRRLGYALRPGAAHIAVGIAIAALLVDLMAWFQWGVRETHALVVASSWLLAALAVVAALSLVMAMVERADAPEGDRRLADLDCGAALVALLLAAGSLALRLGAPGAAGAPPVALLLSTAALIVVAADALVAAGLYAAREWLEPEEHEERRRKGGAR